MGEIYLGDILIAKTGADSPLIYTPIYSNGSTGDIVGYSVGPNRPYFENNTNVSSRMPYNYENNGQTDLVPVTRIESFSGLQNLVSVKILGQSDTNFVPIKEFLHGGFSECRDLVEFIAESGSNVYITISTTPLFINCINLKKIVISNINTSLGTLFGSVGLSSLEYFEATESFGGSPSYPSSAPIINNFPKLKTISIGTNSNFAPGLRNATTFDRTHIQNCPLLEEIIFADNLSITFYASTYLS